MIGPTEKTIEVSREAAERHEDAVVEMIGAWVWVTFDAKPGSEDREALKAAGFRWMKRRGQWAHNCGIRTKAARGYHPREKYGSVLVEDERVERVAE